MPEDRSDVYRWMREWERKISRLFSGAWLESASVSDGMLRFYGGLLRVEAGGRVEIVGTLQVDGTTQVTGTFEITGPWTMTGDGEISGDVTITGKVTQVGDMDIDGVLTVNGDGWSITGNGEISGDVDLSGKVNLTGSFEVEEGGYIQVGPTRISGAIEGFITSLVEVVMKTPLMRLVGSLRVEQAAVFDGDVTMSGLMPIPQSQVPGSFVGAIVQDELDRFRKVISG